MKKLLLLGAAMFFVYLYTKNAVYREETLNEMNLTEVEFLGLERLEAGEKYKIIFDNGLQHNLRIELKNQSSELIATNARGQKSTKRWIKGFLKKGDPYIIYQVTQDTKAVISLTQKK